MSTSVRAIQLSGTPHTLATRQWHPAAGNKVQLDPKLWKKGDTAQKKWLEENVLGGPTPEGYTWHHHQDAGYMQLVHSSIHKAYQHDGGRSYGMWGYPRKP